jgi:hypothetical protein
MLQHSIGCGGRFDEIGTISTGRFESAESPCMKGYAPHGRDRKNRLTPPEND